MCHSPELSLALMVGGWALTALHYYRGNRWALILGFYSVMETLQYYQQVYMGHCGTDSNILSTQVAMALIATQPLLWNYYRWMTNETHKEVFKFGMVASAVWMAAYYSRLLPQDHLLSNPGFYHESNAGIDFCTYIGVDHLGWIFPLYRLNGFEANYFTYLLLWFLPTLWEDNHRWAKLLWWVAQIRMTVAFVPSVHEWASTWCLYSLPILVSSMVIQLYNLR